QFRTIDLMPSGERRGPVGRPMWARPGGRRDWPGATTWGRPYSEMQIERSTPCPAGDGQSPRARVGDDPSAAGKLAPENTKFKAIAFRVVAARRLATSASSRRGRRSCCSLIHDVKHQATRAQGCAPNHDGNILRTNQMEVKRVVARGTM